HNYMDSGTSYELLTYDDKKYERFKRRSEIFYQVIDKDYKSSSDIKTINNELHQCIESIFNVEMEKIIEEQCDC
ncbi:MAG: hypothetical protein MR827_03245, partial [Bacteroidales bacterium]|nr:hypothetical protein [Bacteroidales bacterium]